MQLSQFLRENMKIITVEWVKFAQTLTPAADNMSSLQLKDHIEELLSFIATDIESPQSSAQQIKKSHGKNHTIDNYQESAAETHGNLRHETGFDIVQMVSEYRALRSSIIKLWTEAKSSLTNKDVLDLTRFNEAVDQALAESIVSFMKQLDYSKDLFLGVLGHDIRSPLGAIKMAAHLLPKVGTMNVKQEELTSQIESSSLRISTIVTDLLDLTHARIGMGLPIIKQPMDMSVLAEQVVNEMRTQFPERTFILETPDIVMGEWDITRLGQVFSNLIGNAVQYGSLNTAIKVTIKNEAQKVTLLFHNNGVPIPLNKIPTLFNPFTRGELEHHEVRTLNLGLGLFITREIILSHNGTIHVISKEKEGTTFFITLPKQSQPL
ncbi:MAG: sensor histidine kinase [Pseudomonadota bacterium]